jgi:error-prone DNA polymerase
MELLADAGALRGLAGHRHQARWAVAGVQEPLPLFTEAPAQAEQGVALPLPSVGENLMADYALVGTTRGPHPLRLLRSQLKARGCRSSKQLKQMKDNTYVKVAGLVTGRQRPGTASGVTFVTLEDEHGMINVVVWRTLAERQRKELVHSQLLQVQGKLEHKEGIRHLIASRLTDLTPMLQGLDTRSRDFH